MLFVPVSGPFGRGEYARSLAIAHGIARRWPAASIHFVLSGAAPYAAQTPFPATLLPSSPTFHPAAVSELVARWAPDVVVFDNAGRTVQLRSAQRCGARVVFISARGRQRRKAFRLRWMRLIDEHWIAYPEFIAGAPTFLERCKLKLLRRPVLRYLDVILDARGVHDDAVLAAAKLQVDGYALVVPGGGTGHPGAADAVACFLDAARALAALGWEVLFVGLDAAADATPRLRLRRALPQAELAVLMRGARLVVANGGSTLVQAIACGKACVAAPIAGDQPERIRRCSQAGVAVAAALDTAAIVSVARRLMENDAQREALAGRAVALGLADGVGAAVRAVSALLAAPQGA